MKTQSQLKLPMVTLASLFALAACNSPGPGAPAAYQTTQGAQSSECSTAFMNDFNAISAALAGHPTEAESSDAASLVTQFSKKYSKAVCTAANEDSVTQAQTATTVDADSFVYLWKTQIAEASARPEQAIARAERAENALAEAISAAETAHAKQIALAARLSQAEEAAARAEQALKDAQAAHAAASIAAESSLLRLSKTESAQAEQTNQAIARAERAENALAEAVSAAETAHAKQIAQAARLTQAEETAARAEQRLRDVQAAQDEPSSAAATVESPAPDLGEMSVSYAMTQVTEPRERAINVNVSGLRATTPTILAATAVNANAPRAIAKSTVAPEKMAPVKKVATAVAPAGGAAASATTPAVPVAKLVPLAPREPEIASDGVIIVVKDASAFNNLVNTSAVIRTPRSSCKMINKATSKATYSLGSAIPMITKAAPGSNRVTGASKTGTFFLIDCAKPANGSGGGWTVKELNQALSGVASVMKGN